MTLEVYLLDDLLRWWPLLWVAVLLTGIIRVEFFWGTPEEPPAPAPAPIPEPPPEDPPGPDLKKWLLALAALVAALVVGFWWWGGDEPPPGGVTSTEVARLPRGVPYAGVGTLAGVLTEIYGSTLTGPDQLEGLVNLCIKDPAQTAELMAWGQEFCHQRGHPSLFEGAWKIHQNQLKPHLVAARAHYLLWEAGFHETDPREMSSLVDELVRQTYHQTARETFAVCYDYWDIRTSTKLHLNTLTTPELLGEAIKKKGYRDGEIPKTAVLVKRKIYEGGFPQDLSAFLWEELRGGTSPEELKTLVNQHWTEHVGKVISDLPPHRRRPG